MSKPEAQRSPIPISALESVGGSLLPKTNQREISTYSKFIALQHGKGTTIPNITLYMSII
jgi:hypothetical protein